MMVDYIYVVGERPTPMIAVNSDSNLKIFNEEYEYNFGDYTPVYKHLWNMNAYIIYDVKTNKIISYRFNEIEYFVWLLRIINLPLEMIFNEKFVVNNQDFFKNYIDEFACKSN